MLTDRHFQTLAFPWRIYDSQGKMIAQGDGCLFPIPEQAKKSPSEEYYPVAPVGWSVCPAGYAVYVLTLKTLFDHRLVIPGLKVNGLSKVSGKSALLSLKTDTREIERYVDETLGAYENIHGFFQTLIERSVHEMRGINRDIKAATADITDHLSGGPQDIDAARVRTNNIKALSEILGSRADFLDYLANPNASFKNKIQIKVYQKFDKTVRSLGKRASDKGVPLLLRGNSVGQVYGLPVFEVIPYLLIENALKYSPARETVTVNFWEGADKIIVTVQNMGPLMTPEEISKVSEFGFRGANAIRGFDGTGIGMFFLKDLVERHHEAEMEFSQFGTPKRIGDLDYTTTQVRLTFKRSDVVRDARLS